MHYQSLLDYFCQAQPAILERIGEWVRQETPSHDKARLDALAAALATRLQAAGATVETIANEDAGNHVRASMGETHSGVKPALILCHFDTVWPVGTLACMPFRIENGRAFGPGIFDMKSSLALVEYALHAINHLRLAPPRPLTMLFTSDEEVGSRSSRQLIEREARRSEYVAVMESPLPGGVLKTARKGIGSYKLDITGRAAHAGVDPEKGASAVLELGQQIVRLYELNDWAKGTTVNIGVVQGGSAANVVAAAATAQIDVRAWSQEEKTRVISALQNLTAINSDCRLHLSGGWNRPPLERSVTAELFGQVRAIGAKLGLDLQEGGTGGGSDGNLTGALGIPTIDGMGVPGAGAHADHEQIEIDGIASRGALLTALLIER